MVEVGIDSPGRVFAAVSVPHVVRQALWKRLLGLELPGKVSRPENWHVTLRYLGEVDIVTYERFLAGLAEANLGSSFMVSLSELGAFPNPRKATVLWVGVDQGVARLSSLASATEDSAQAAGLEAEERPFLPHLTISRIRPPRNVSRLLEEPLEDLRWRCDALVVYRSRLEGRQPIYEPLETFELNR